MKKNHSNQALKHIAGGALLVIVALALISVLGGALSFGPVIWLVRIVSLVVGVAGLYILAGGTVLMLMSRAHD